MITNFVVVSSNTTIGSPTIIGTPPTITSITTTTTTFPPGLVLNLDPNNYTGGLSLTDTSGYSNNAQILVGAGTYSNYSGITFSFYKPGSTSCFSFIWGGGLNNASFYFNCGTGSSITNLTASTINMWIWSTSYDQTLFVKTSGLGGWGIVMNGGAGVIDGGNVSSPGSGLIRPSSSATDMCYLINNSVIPNNTWFLYTISYNGNWGSTASTTIYINGVTQSNVSINQPGTGVETSDASLPLYFASDETGFDIDTNSSNYYGYFGLLQIYNQVLTSSQILNLYNSRSSNYSSIVIPTATIVGYVVATSIYSNSAPALTYSCTTPIYSSNFTFGEIGYNTYYIDSYATIPLSTLYGPGYSYATQSGVTSSIMMTVGIMGQVQYIYNWGNATNGVIPNGYWIQSSTKVNVGNSNQLYTSLFTPTLYLGQYVQQTNGYRTFFSVGTTYAWAPTSNTTATILFTVATASTPNINAAIINTIQ